MKPELLRMTAFGPYRGTENIDFTLLHAHRLFVISGNTGAGKTTIFDAICYALYGSASGEDRSDPRMLRSHFADEAVHTAVDLSFSVGSERYRIVRQMAHRKEGNRGETGARIEFYQWNGEQYIPAVDRFTVTEVNARVEQIIGLSKDQFSQIVMLPQGEFRRLLTSDTDNKEEILRRIFRTEQFERLERSLQQQAREMQEQLRDYRALERSYVQQTLDLMPLRVASTLEQLAGQTDALIGTAQLLPALDEEQLYYSQQAEQVAVLLNSAEERAQQLDEELRAAETLNQRIDAYEKLLAEQRELEGRQLHMEQQEQRALLAERALQLAPYAQETDRAQALAQAKEQQHKQALLRRDEAMQAAQITQQAFATEQAKEPERKAVEQELHRLQDLVPIVQELASQQQKLEQLIKHQRESEQLMQSKEQELQQAKAQLVQLLEELKITEAKADAIADGSARMLQIEHQGNQVKRLIKQADILEKLRQQEAQVQQRLNAERQAVAQMEQQWMDSQAALLTAHLADGSPCPVCGSLHHPEPAIVANGAQLVTREALQQAREQLAAIESELSLAAQQTATTAAICEEAVSDLRSSGLDAGGWSVTQLAHQREQLLQEWMKLRAAKDEREQLQAAARQQRQQEEQLRQRAETLQAAYEASRQARDECRLACAALEGRREQLAAQVPPELRDPAAAEQRYAALQKRSRELAQQLEQALERQQAAATASAQQQVLAQEAHAQQAEALAHAAEALERLQEQLLQAGFAGRAAYEAALLPREQLAAMRSELGAYQLALAAVQKQLAERAADAAGRSRADIAPLLAHKEQLRQQVAAHIAQAQEASRLAVQAARLRLQLADASAQQREQEQRTADLLDVFQTLRGDNPHKLSFERYILTAYLDHILEAANERLKQLSGGQFQLERSGRLEQRGKQSGLGLDVFDAYTGLHRDVKTLSGGEKFHASLALALGMTDVIQAHQGGIVIEMMFIDEGFGSLDEEALHKAIGALADLEQAGRMIGVISHVQELKQIFPATIEVGKEPDGASSTKIVLR